MTPASRHSIDEILTTRKILITGGTGGVGKTTVSAAMALRAAMLGRKTVVITMDPAKRLATSLGLEGLGDHPTDLTPRLRKVYDEARAAGMKVPSHFEGRLDAIMPDTRKTFEDFVHSLAQSKEMAERVIQNPIFQIFAKEFSGANEYMAMQRVFALSNENRYDLIILDTPPSRNTLDFLDAPKLLGQFFDDRIIRLLVMPANRLMAAPLRKVLGLLEKLTGAGFMTHLLDFAQALFEVRFNFTKNLNRVTELMASPDTGFLLVAAPSPEKAPEIAHFIDSVREHGFHFEGMALNRTLGYLKTEGEESPATLLIRSLQARERQAVDALMGELKEHAPYYAKLPELARDVHSVEDLFHVALALDTEFTSGT
jgi:anion-transporting  ArsA/GET3 family ATPase